MVKAFILRVLICTWPARFVSEAFRQADFDKNGGIDCVETLGRMDESWTKGKSSKIGEKHRTRNGVWIGEIIFKWF